MITNALEFERPIVELEKKIEDLEKFASQEGLNFSTEIEKLNRKMESLKEEIYGNLTEWQCTQVARHSARPYTLDFAEHVFTDFQELHGDRAFADDKSIVGGLCRFEGQSVMLIGHQKGRNTAENIRRNFAMPNPEGYRKALRFMKLAEKFNLPIITLVDTPGAYPGIGAEERGQGEAIARNLLEMSGLKVPIISVVTGEGGSGGALALAVGNRVLMFEHSIYSVISPEGCAAILWKDGTQGEKAAKALKLTAPNLLKLGVIDEVIPEPMGGAHRDPAVVYANLKEALNRHLQELQKLSAAELTKDRYDRFRKIGVFSE
ncbi:acetyl-CoA carboxylase carboxyltransferase subunit alpha [Desulfurispirillum indicum]|uniref:Acetyl-coenzyme A carboxylase carboxyl transferase subunit alpha n=1 Tax=Desulfurispirillum indicum (strain ATCC BAA-1389 / DSM 22839 / S5) TaxID=653733 RepID=E6W2T7_DESIS|nr:acetyl-CoA carboxylase carboxyltransferase subunit alpha [Desulfurispirillum indicum]ADU66762.1 acetyl-CoA carboxylase, carboxyl transferase, alpha subunit [Desulfurispirillum indicum S5]UCZ56083.1 acetyl-CoA carboxylase carboxyltransferase subunit alpha [Desulfurispirillum indicum]